MLVERSDYITHSVAASKLTNNFCLIVNVVNIRCSDKNLGEQNTYRLIFTWTATALLIAYMNTLLVTSSSWIWYFHNSISLFTFFIAKLGVVN